MQLFSISRSLGWWSYLFIIIINVILLTPNLVNGIAVMSVDLGSEWMKVAIVSPGVPMEIALNKESKRKTPVAIAFRDNERLFGEDALGVGVRFPKLTYSYILELLGKPVTHPLVQLFKQRFPYYDIVPDPVRGTVVFRHDDETQFTPEELVGMLLQKAREFAQNSAIQAINEVVITVPGYFNQAERKAVLQAAELSGLKVLQLMNDYTAVALNYGIFRRKDFNETAQYMMFYDMGASSTTATVVSFQLVKIKDKGVTETHPQVQIVGVGYDRTLGGLEMQIRLRDYLGKKFNEMKKTPNDVFKNPRAMAKLFKEAGRLKNVLSANTEHFAQVEGLLDEKDFKLLVTREQFEQLCTDLADRVRGPIEQALKTSSLTMDLISNVVLVGAGTRVPFVQDRLTKVVNMELSKNLNTDEAAVLGAVYKAADLSTGFKVKKFITRDAVLFPIQVVFERDTDGSVRQVKRMLFGPMNPFPQKKILTFNKYVNDFGFNVIYAELDHLYPHEIANIGNLHLMQVDLKGVQEAHAKHQGDNVESKGIKAHFTLDDSSVLSLSSVELVLEKTADDSAAQEESPLSKLGSTISKLFTGPEDTLKDNLGEKPVKEQEGEGKTEGETSDKKEEGEQQKSESATGEGKAEEIKRNETTKEGEKKKPKAVVVKEVIKTSEIIIGIPPLGEKHMQESLKKIETLNQHDELKRKREGALNALESFVFDVKVKLEEEPYIAAATDAEVTSIRNTCAQIFDWLDEEGFNAETAALEAKLSELKSVTRPVWRRVREHEERPEASAALDATINGSLNFLNTIKNMTANNTEPEETVFTPVEIELLEKTISETVDWKKKTTEEQSRLKLSDTPKLTVKSLVEKMHNLDREVKYLVNKAKIWKPKKKEEPKSKDDAEDKKQQTFEDNTGAQEDENVIRPDDTNKSESEVKSDRQEQEELKKDDDSKDDGGTKDEIPSLPEQKVKPEPSKTDKEEMQHTEL
ncbi:hypoxia up-regulated Grp170 co-chaperone protein isoform X2 [Lycorma delicatula]|uniref:hypoxia up-regulated Grp170 co-chaperone protein isoform X2 n=1 Tax=Lycorma delicatula TaxID=130591 RepID=UPI003F517118